MTSISERVAAGAAFLDEHEPGWDQRIVLDELSIDSSCKCILGQLYGSFAEGLLDLRFISVYPTGYDVDLGFIWDLRPGASKNEPADLTAEWKRVITERRSAS